METVVEKLVEKLYQRSVDAYKDVLGEVTSKEDDSDQKYVDMCNEFESYNEDAAKLVSALLSEIRKCDVQLSCDSDENEISAVKYTFLTTTNRIDDIKSNTVCYVLREPTSSCNTQVLFVDGEVNTISDSDMIISNFRLSTYEEIYNFVTNCELFKSIGGYAHE